jgi:hypothetical protein
VDAEEADNEGIRVSQMAFEIALRSIAKESKRNRVRDLEVLREESGLVKIYQEGKRRRERGGNCTLYRQNWVRAGMSQNQL